MKSRWISNIDYSAFLTVTAEGSSPKLLWKFDSTIFPFEESEYFRFFMFAGKIEVNQFSLICLNFSWN